MLLNYCNIEEYTANSPPESTPTVTGIGYRKQMRKHFLQGRIKFFENFVYEYSRTFK